MTTLSECAAHVPLISLLQYYCIILLKHEQDCECSQVISCFHKLALAVVVVAAAAAAAAAVVVAAAVEEEEEEKQQQQQ